MAELSPSQDMLCAVSDPARLIRDEGVALARRVKSDFNPQNFSFVSQPPRLQTNENNQWHYRKTVFFAFASALTSPYHPVHPGRESSLHLHRRLVTSDSRSSSKTVFFALASASFTSSFTSDSRFPSKTVFFVLALASPHLDIACKNIYTLA